MIVYLNGRFVPEEEAMVPIADRGFTYGDGVFETLLIRNSRPFRWEAHWSRFEAGASALGISPPQDCEAVREVTAELIARNGMPESVLRYQLSRGSGARGYSPKGAVSPTFAMSLHPAPEFAPEPPRRLRVMTSTVRMLADSATSVHKTGNRLLAVLARSEAEQSGFDDAILLNERGEVVEASSSNLFWIEGETLVTPPLSSGALAGVTRAVILDLARAAGMACVEQTGRPDRLRAAAGAFLSSSTTGVSELVAVDGITLPCHALTADFRQGYFQLLERECSRD